MPAIGFTFVKIVRDFLSLEVKCITTNNFCAARFIFSFARLFRNRSRVELSNGDFLACATIFRHVSPLNLANRRSESPALHCVKPSRAPAFVILFHGIRGGEEGEGGFRFCSRGWASFNREIFAFAQPVILLISFARDRASRFFFYCARESCTTVDTLRENEIIVATIFLTTL